MKIDYGGLDVHSREAQQMRIAHMRNWKNWPQEEKDEWFKWHKEPPYSWFQDMFWSGLGLTLMILVVIVCGAIGFVIDKKYRAEEWAATKRLARRIWKRS